MIHTSITRNCVVFFLPRRLTRSAIMNGRPCQFATVKENRAILSDTCVDHFIILLKHLSNHMHFITNGYRTLFIDQLVRLGVKAGGRRFCPRIFVCPPPHMVNCAQTSSDSALFETILLQPMSIFHNRGHDLRWTEFPGAQVKVQPPHKINSHSKQCKIINIQKYTKNTCKSHSFLL